MGWKTNKDTKTHFQTGKKRGLSMNQRHGSTNPTGMKMGRGAIVETKEIFGIGDVPVGTKGVVIDHFNKKPVVRFEGLSHSYVPDEDRLKVIQGSAKFDSTRHPTILVVGTKHELKKKLLDEIGINDAGDDWLYGYVPVFDEAGFQSDVYYSLKVKDNGVEIHLQKQNIPRFARDSYEGIFEDIKYHVEDALGLDK